MKSENREQSITKAGRLVGAVLSVAAVIFAVCLLTLSSVDAALTDTALELSGGIGDKASIPYGEISSVEWRDTFEKGSRTWGTGTMKISSGTFTNEEFGAYKLYFHNDVAPAVVVRCGDGSVTVFNGETAQETQALYEALARRTAG